MIIVRSPSRITLGGSVTDHPSYYYDYEGFTDLRGDQQIRLCSAERDVGDGLCS